jgi:Alkylmercury lyase
MSTADRLPEKLHYLLIKHVIEMGYAPDVQKLSDLAALPQPQTEAGLQQLAAMHGVILVPNSFEVWSLHPFSMSPTRHWVTAGQRGWWANCAWCSLAIGAALRVNVQISTGDGGEGTALTFAILDGRSSRPEVLMHFPFPPARWWDNPFCPCGNILFFSSSAAIDEWCVRHGRPRGAVLDMPTGIALATEWFGDYAFPEWRRKTPEQARAIFEKLGLDPQFWITPPSFK